MMQRRDFYFLVPIGIVLVGAVIFEMLLSGRGPIPNPAPVPVFPGLAEHLDDLAWMRVSRGPTKVDFANVAGRWVAVEKDNYPADPARISKLLGGLAKLTIVEPDTHAAGSAGRAEPGGTATGEPTRIVLRSRSGDTAADATIAAAPFIASGGSTDLLVVRKLGAEGEVLARGSLELPGDVLSWLDRGILDLPAGRIASLELTGTNGVRLTLTHDSSDAAFAVTGLPEGSHLKPNARLSDLAGVLTELEFDDVKPLALAEFPQSGVARATVKTFDDLAIDLRLFARDGTDWVAVAASGTGAAEAESNAINDRVARWAYAIPAARAKLLRTRIDDLAEPAKGL
ncbi:MAG: hypothetical protein AB7H71_09765 [Alphaproteobacteria bacterium]